MKDVQTLGGEDLKAVAGLYGVQIASGTTYKELRLMIKAKLACQNQKPRESLSKSYEAHRKKDLIEHYSRAYSSKFISSFDIGEAEQRVLSYWTTGKGRHMRDDKVDALSWAIRDFRKLPEPLVPLLEIFFDDGSSHIEKNLKKTNACQVLTTSEKGVEYLTYERSEPDEIQDGVFQKAEYAVDMYQVAALRVTKADGKIEVNLLKPCANVDITFRK